MKCAGRGNLSILKLLLDFDADLHQIDQVGCNALCYASVTGKVDIIRFLVFEAGISLCSTDVS
jgi:hypothetical protein